MILTIDLIQRLCVLWVAAAISLLTVLVWQASAFCQETQVVRSADGSLRVEIEKTSRGLFCNEFTVGVGDASAEYGGFRCSFLAGGVEFTGAEWTVADNRLVIEHTLSNGDTITGELFFNEAARAIQCRFSSLASVAHIEAGSLRSKVTRLYSDLGWAVEAPSKPHTRYRLMTNFVVTEREDGWIELLGCDLGSGYTFDPATNQCTVGTLYRVPEATFTLLLDRDESVSDLVRRYRSTVYVTPPATMGRLAHRFLFDDWTGMPTSGTIGQLERLRYYGCTRLFVLFHVWQRFGYDVSYPDIFPPSEQVGGVEGLRALAQYCQGHDIPFGLHDNYSDLYPDAPSFKLDYVAMRPTPWRREGSDPYHRGWFNERTGVRAYGWDRESALKFADKNFERINDAVRLTSYFLDVTSYGDPLVYENPDGVFHDPAESLRHERALYELARRSFGDVPVVGEGCSEKFLGAVDAAGSDLWSADRWGVDPGGEDWEFYPLFNLAFHPDIICYGAGYQTRYRLPEADFTFDFYGEQTRDDYRATRILFGNSGFWWIAALSQIADDWGLVKEYYLSVPLAERTERVPMTAVTWADGDMHRIRVEYENGMTVWVNRGNRPWKVERYVLPHYGVLVKGDGFFQGTFAWNASRVDVVNSESLLFVDMRGRLNEYDGVATDGALVVEKGDDAVVIRPLYGVTGIRMAFEVLMPGRDFTDAAVTVKGWHNKVLDEFKLEDNYLVLDESRPLRVVDKESGMYDGRPFGYFPYYVVKP